MKNEIKGLVFDVQGYSVHDGPGCRTLVFMKGCPLRCEWCSNPEGMRVKQDLMYKNVKCMHVANQCNRCLEVCPHQAISVNLEYKTSDDQQLLFDRMKCNECQTLDCLSVCYFEGLKACGEWKTVEDVIHIFERNRHYWGATGGASFSGGEPLLQTDYMETLLKTCHERKIHTAVETTAYIKPENFLKLMKYVDFAFIDVKHMDSNKHYEKTGVHNELIHQNIEALTKTKWPGRLVLRMPVIEGYNDTQENLEAIAEFMKRVGLVELNILPFHRLGDSKWSQLGKEYAYRESEATPEERMYQIQDFFLEKRIACYIGSETPF